MSPLSEMGLSDSEPINVDMTLTQLAEICHPALVAERDDALNRLQRLIEAVEATLCDHEPCARCNGLRAAIERAEIGA